MCRSIAPPTTRSPADRALPGDRQQRPRYAGPDDVAAIESMRAACRIDLRSARTALDRTRFHIVATGPNQLQLRLWRQGTGDLVTARSGRPSDVLCA
ncbi:hypothetical protein [Nocardia beijingensis]|uniref:hypothetical protein n=1 Tax=Nocardia beijingensis TaxID=95162 RepID=UPI0012F48AD8|nr:hypothetical protein [Nocardia beijingensis]